MLSPRLSGFNLQYVREEAVAQGEELAQVIAGARLLKMVGESHSLMMRSAKTQNCERQFFKEVGQK